MTAPSDDKLLKILQDSVDDPMWADHVEMPKRILRIVIERLRAGVAQNAPSATTDAEQLYRRVITKDRIYYEPAERQQSPRLEREAIEDALCEAFSRLDDDQKVHNGYVFAGADAILALLSPDTTVVSSTSRGEVGK